MEKNIGTNIGMYEREDNIKVSEERTISQQLVDIRNEFGKVYKQETHLDERLMKVETLIDELMRRVG